MKNTKLVIVLLLVFLLASACSSSGQLTVQDAWARPASAGDNGAAYFVIENGMNTDDTLLSVSSDIARATEVHKSTMNDAGVMSMQLQESVPVPARENVEFEPGGLHVMFVELTQDLTAGETISLTLNLERAGSLTIQVPVEEQQ